MVDPKAGGFVYTTNRSEAIRSNNDDDSDGRGAGNNKNNLPEAHGLHC